MSEQSKIETPDAEALEHAVLHMKKAIETDDVTELYAEEAAAVLASLASNADEVERLRGERDEYQNAMVEARRTAESRLDRLQQRSVDEHERRETVAVSLGIDTTTEPWWDANDKAKDDQINAIASALLSRAESAESRAERLAAELEEARQHNEDLTGQRDYLKAFYRRHAETADGHFFTIGDVVCWPHDFGGQQPEPLRGRVYHDGERWMAQVMVPTRIPRTAVIRDVPVSECYHSEASCLASASTESAARSASSDEGEG